MNLFKNKKILIGILVLSIVSTSGIIYVYAMNNKINDVALLPEIKGNELVEVVNEDGTTKLISMDEYNNGTYQTLTQKNVNDIKVQKEAEAKAQEEARIKVEQEAKAQAAQQAQASANNYNSSASSSTKKPASNGGSQSKPSTSTSTGGGSTQTPSTPSIPQQPQPQYFATLPFYVDTVFSDTPDQWEEHMKVQQWFTSQGIYGGVSAWTDGSYDIIVDGWQYSIEPGTNIVTKVKAW